MKIITFAIAVPTRRAVNVKVLELKLQELGVNDVDVALRGRPLDMRCFRALLVGSLFGDDPEEHL